MSRGIQHTLKNHPKYSLLLLLLLLQLTAVVVAATAFIVAIAFRSNHLHTPHPIDQHRPRSHVTQTAKLKKMSLQSSSFLATFRCCAETSPPPACLRWPGSEWATRTTPMVQSYPSPVSKPETLSAPFCTGGIEGSKSFNF